MWCGPHDSLSVGESITNTILLGTILQEMSNEHYYTSCADNNNDDDSDKPQSDNNNNNTIMEAIESICLRRVQQLQKLAAARLLEIELGYGNVQPLSDADGRKFAHQVATLRANTMSWSNLMDYLKLSDFHALAQAYSSLSSSSSECCCSSSCIHYGYTMNWTATMFGADIIDYDGLFDREAILEQTYGSRAERLFPQTDAAKLLVFAFYKNPRMQTSYVLAQMLQNKWLQYFCSHHASTAADAADAAADDTSSSAKSKLRVLSSGLALENPLTRSPKTLYLTWKYDGDDDDDNNDNGK